jgi:hypothetical protein
MNFNKRFPVDLGSRIKKNGYDVFSMVRCVTPRKSLLKRVDND